MIKSKHKNVNKNKFLLSHTIREIEILTKVKYEEYYTIGNQPKIYYRRGYVYAKDKEITREQYLKHINNNENVYLDKNDKAFFKPHIHIKYVESHTNYSSDIYFNTVKECRNFIKNNII